MEVGADRALIAGAFEVVQSVVPVADQHLSKRFCPGAKGRLTAVIFETDQGEGGCP